jgi:hypothetical protein
MGLVDRSEAVSGVAADGVRWNMQVKDDFASARWDTMHKRKKDDDLTVGLYLEDQRGR